MTPEIKARISSAAAKVVAEAPPLDPQQAAHLNRIFAGSAQRIRERRAQSSEQKPAA